MSREPWPIKLSAVFAFLAIASLVLGLVFRTSFFPVLASAFALGWIVFLVYGIALAITKKWFTAIPLAIVFLGILFIISFPGAIFDIIK